MPNIVANVPNFVSGVSQQPRTMRFPSQAEESINAYPSIVEGLIKRPPTQYIKQLYNDTGVSSATTQLASHFIDRSESEKYITQIREGKVRVWDLLGNEKLVWHGGNTPSLTPTAEATAFLNTGTTAHTEAFKFLTIADYTFVLNKTKYPQYSNEVVTNEIVGTSKPRRIKVASITLRQLTERSTFKVRIDCVTPAGVPRTCLFTVETFNYAKTTDGSDYSPDTRTTLQRSDNYGAYTTIYQSSWDNQEKIIQTDYILGGLSTWMSTGTPGYATQSSPSGTATNLATATGHSNWAFASQGSTMMIWNTGTGTGSGYDANGDLNWAISCTDSYGGTAVQLNWEEVQSFADLPKSGVQNSIFKIVGYPQDKGDEYWVKFVPNIVNSGAGSVGEGQWKETIKPGEYYKINPVTMPWVLVKFSNGEFGFTPLDGSTRTYGGTSYTAPKWANKLCGDSDTNPNPTFLNNYNVEKTRINDIFFYKNRLGFLSEENIIFSESGEYFNFFKTTITQELDSDPIDVASSSPNVSDLNYAIPFFDRLLIFSENSQFTLTSADNLTSKSVSIQTSTAFSSLNSVQPLPVGRNIYFPFYKDNFSGIKEYYLSPDTNFMDANDITINVPKYLKNKVKCMTASETENVIAVLTHNKYNELYIYKYLNLGTERVQGAWCKFIFSPDTIIINMFFKKEIMYLLIKRESYVYLEKIDFQSFSVKDTLEYTPRLDRLTPVYSASALVTKPNLTGITTSYSSVLDQTFITFPFNFGTATPKIVLGSNPEANSSLKFSGSEDSYAYSSSSSDFYYNSLPSTLNVAGHFKLTSLSNQIVLNLDKGSLKVWKAFQLNIKNSQLNAMLKTEDNMGVEISASGLQLDKWHYFNFVYDATGNTLNLKLGLTGTSVATATIATPVTFTNPSFLNIGEISSNFSGFLDNLSISGVSTDLTIYYADPYNGSKTYETIRSVLTTNLVSFFGFDSLDGNLIKDINSDQIIFDKVSGKFSSPDNPSYYTQPYDEIPVVSYSYTSSSSTLVISGGISAYGGPIYVGVPYNMIHTISPISLRAPGQKGGQILVASGVLSLKYGYIAYTNTKVFSVIVSSNDPVQGNVYSYDFKGEKQLETGIFKFPIFCSATNALITLVNSSFDPCCFVSGDFEGTLTNQFQRA
ncbi:MAG: hypothetical protein EBU90_06840 [Proteobacteria bacterium]|nr:hypothetical protein [Pseudomonadota bacterium]NBP14036.1 hypothetical protein [bacterium]